MKCPTQGSCSASCSYFLTTSFFTMDLILFGWQLFASRTVLLDVTVVFLHSALKVIPRPSCVANVLASLTDGPKGLLFFGVLIGSN